MTRTFRRLTAGLLAAGLVWAVGCESGPKTYRLSGKVTFNGQPVPMGKIYFDPDPTAGNSGQSGFADIVDGAFDTSAANGRGVAGGPTIVRIVGNKKEPADPTSGYGPLLFAEYSVKAELPRETSTKDFDVPASAAKGLPKNPAPLDADPDQAPRRGGGT
jgi:hypothetical protein